MKVSIKQTAADEYLLSFDDTQVSATGADLKDLLLAVTGVLMPDAGQSDDEHTRQFINQIKTANDVGIQMLLRVADQDDILVLLKHGEGDEALLDKFYRNMSERSRKIFAEDLIYKFKDKVPAAQVNAAVNQLIVAARDLEDKGSLVYGAS
jgi:hypothetical protein